jgi:pimeloyl-ACP methyl ester carboxylesterase
MGCRPVAGLSRQDYGKILNGALRTPAPRVIDGSIGNVNRLPQETLILPDGARIAYRRLPPAGDRRPGLVFLSGFASDMSGTKGTALEAWAQARGQAMLRFDYSGHGQSSGAFRDGTVGRWTEDALAALDRLTQGPQILVGSSMGGWIMLLVARARPQRIAGLVGIAAAPDFTEDLMWAQMQELTRARLMAEGVILQPSRYQDAPMEISRDLIEDGRRHLLLRSPIDIRCPIRLLHGMSDPDVPWQTSTHLAERLTSADVTVTLVKDGDHRLSREQDLRRIFAAVGELSREPEAL